jgi:hypothetical protein
VTTTAGASGGGCAASPAPTVGEAKLKETPMRFPYGLADFATLIDEGYFYVDRTDRIPLLEDAGKQLLFLRPRRFGKSLWLSTLENYYDLVRADDFERLFGNLKIGRNPTPLRNRYFTLKLNFSMVDQPF